MFNKQAALKRHQGLAAEVKTRLDNGTLTKSFMDEVEAETADIEHNIKNHELAMVFRAGGEIREPLRPTGTKSLGAQVAPLGFDDLALKALHTAALSRQSLQIKQAPDYSTVSPLGQQLPMIVGPQHESRLLDRLPATATNAPSVEYIRHTSTTGVPAVVSEGGLKPALVFNTDRVACTPVKIAAHVAASHESLEDFPSFTGYIHNELSSQLVDVENDELLNGTGPGHMTGLLATPNILDHDAGDDDTALDAIEASIAELRVGAALATANLLVLHPSTWSAIRRTKDLQDRYLVTADPTQGEANTVWGVPVLTTTALDTGAGVLLDTTKMGYVVVREAITIKTGTNGDDLIYNLTRFVGEERLGLAVERPAAVLSITGLPTGTPGS